MDTLPRHARTAWIWLSLPLLASAWTRDWWAPDEPRYAEVSRELARSGEYLVMHLCGEVYPNKPPLLFWLSALCGKLFGWSEFALRLPVLAATLATAWLVQRLARRAWGEAEAALAPVLYLTSAMVLWHGARLQIDPLLGALTTGALVLANEPCTTRTRRAWFVASAGFLVGLAVLAKGPVALILVGLPLAAWRWLDGRPPIPAPRAAWVAAVVAALLPGLAWALAVVARHPDLAYDLFLGQFFERAIAGRNHISPFWYHAAVQLPLMLPWTLPILAGSVLGWRALRARLRGAEHDRGAARAALWFWPLFLAFSASPEKRDIYLLPAYPALALLGARWFAETLRARAFERWIAAAGPLCLALVGATACAARAYERGLPPELQGLTWQPFAIGLPLVAAGWLAARGARGAAPVRSVAATAAGLALAAFAAACLCYPRVNPSKSPRALATYVDALPQAPPAIPCFGVQPEGYRFYSGRPFVASKVPGGAVAPAFATHESVFVSRLRGADAQFLALVVHDDWARWSAATRAAAEVLHSQSVSGREVLVVGARGHPDR